MRSMEGMTMTIDELITALNALTKPDRSLDCEIWVLAKGGDARMHYVDTEHSKFVWERGIDGMWIRAVENFAVKPRYTASVDHVLQLIPQMLPTANCWALDKDPRGIQAHVQRNNVKSGHWDGFAEHPSLPAVALLLAILKAKVAGHGA